VLGRPCGVSVFIAGIHSLAREGPDGGGSADPPTLCACDCVASRLRSCVSQKTCEQKHTSKGFMYVRAEVHQVANYIMDDLRVVARWSYLSVRMW
jgi:hypothetical protein